jgi:hypothetical protein
MGNSDEDILVDQGIAAQKGKINRLRKLKQFKDMTDEEFEASMSQKALGIATSEEFEKRIQKKLDEFEKDYDLSDLKINDRETLRAFVQAVITLEEYEQYLFKVRSQGINDSSLYMIEKLQKAMSDLRADISKLQTDLNITRKIRKADKDLSVMAYLDDLKGKAQKFYASKMSYVFCKKCNMLLGTFWTMYPENERNKIVLVCERVLDDGTRCGEKAVIGTKELLGNRGTSSREITPESML